MSAERIDSLSSLFKTSAIQKKAGVKAQGTVSEAQDTLALSPEALSLQKTKMDTWVQMLHDMPATRPSAIERGYSALAHSAAYHSATAEKITEEWFPS